MAPRARALVSIVAAGLALAGCVDRPKDTRVVCHNANCTGPPDPSRDDRIDSLAKSLALVYDGRPLLDGVEIDVFWHGASGRCLFAHDLNDVPRAVDASAAAQAIADYLVTPGLRSYDGQAFTIRMELKGFVGAIGDEHSDAQAVAHAECALDLFDIYRRAALDSGQNIAVIFDSSAPKLLKTLVAQPRWPGRTRSGQVQVRLSADFVDSTPSGLAFQKLADFPEVDDVLFHAGWINDAHYQAFRSLDVELTIWMFSATVETFDAIERFEPAAVLTSEAPLLRRWLEY
jgi:hypothetical protein